MTLSEDAYTDLVEEMLVSRYGEENVERGAYIEEVERFADFIVRAWPVDMAIEVENDFESVFDGVGQALVYAAGQSDMTPVIIRPPLEDGSDINDSRYLAHHVSIKEFNPKEWNTEE